MTSHRVRIWYPYQAVLEKNLCDNLPHKLLLADHIDGVDTHGRNRLLDILHARGQPRDIALSFIPNADLKESYPLFNLWFDVDEHVKRCFSFYEDYRMHPQRTHQHFMCAFNGGPHVNRKLLLAAVHRMGWFSPHTVTKNFSFSIDELDGHIRDYCVDNDEFYRKFFIGADSQAFFAMTNGANYQQFGHLNNVRALETMLTSSFVNIVTESMGTSYNPFVTEKFLFSVITRGLFVAYAQPGWHNQIESIYGFQLFRKLFDYGFDSITNPIDRLLALLASLAKFQQLGQQDWHDLYLLEMDSIEHNYEHYFSGRYVERLKTHCCQS